MPHRRVLCLLLSLPALQAAGEPAVIAHRGGAALRPENTIAAFRHALELGVSILEFDMNLTADGNIVIHHDHTVNPKICQALQVAPAPLATLRLADIRQFDCGSFQRPNSPQFQPAPGERMPTLDEFLAAVKSSRAMLLGETKMTEATPPDRFADLIHAALRRHNLTGRFILQSSDYRTIDAMSKKDAQVQLCLLGARRSQPKYLDLARRHRATHLMLRWDEIAAGQIAPLRSAGIKLFSGTSNSREEWKKYLDLGFDGILTDNPQALIEFIKKGR